MKELLRPNVALVTAWRPELDAVKSMIKSSSEVVLPKEKEDVIYYHGKIHGLDTVFLESGVGMTESAITTSDLLSRYPSVRYLLVAGVAGNLQDEDIAKVSIPYTWIDYSRQLFARECTDNSFGTPSHMSTYLQGTNFGMIHPLKTKPINVDRFLFELAKRLSGCESGSTDNRIVVGGQGLSASIFLDNHKFREYLRSSFPEATVVDMESYAILKAAKRHTGNNSAIAIRVSSDLAGGKTDKNELSNSIDSVTQRLSTVLDAYLYLVSKEQ